MFCRAPDERLVKGDGSVKGDGHPVNATASQLTTAFTAIGVMGALVIVLGAVAMRKKQ
jgi:hypothetical protein